MTRRRLALAIKRTVDFAGSAVGLVALSPVLAATAAMIRATMGGPVLFRQTRPGYQGRPFGVLKFRTMNDACDANGELLPDGERLTAVGRFVRSTSLDELPQLWNVLKGEMSLVGPRPLLMRYLPRYSPAQARRHEVKPGMTGWAQVNGRADNEWSIKLAYDTWYVDNWSLWLDAKILARTVMKTLRREGISRRGYATSVEFWGTERQGTA